MSGITYKYIDPPATAEKAVAFLQNTLVPLLDEYWSADGEPVYGKPIQFNILTFAQMWNMGSLVIITAEEDKKPVGLYIGVRFVPIMYKANALQTEVLYGQTEGVRQGLCDYLMTIVSFMNIDEIRASDEFGKKHPELAWEKKEVHRVQRYVKC